MKTGIVLVLAVVLTGCTSAADETAEFVTEQQTFCTDYADFGPGVKALVEKSLTGAQRPDERDRLAELGADLLDRAPEVIRDDIAVIAEPLDTLKDSYAAGTATVTLPDGWASSYAAATDYCVAVLD